MIKANIAIYNHPSLALKNSHSSIFNVLLCHSSKHSMLVFVLSTILIFYSDQCFSLIPYNPTDPRNPNRYFPNGLLGPNNFYQNTCPYYQFPVCDLGKYLCGGRCCDFGCYHGRDGTVLGCSQNKCFVMDLLAYQPSCSYGCQPCDQECVLDRCQIICCNIGQPSYCVNSGNSYRRLFEKSSLKSFGFIILLVFGCFN